MCRVHVSVCARKRYMKASRLLLVWRDFIYHPMPPNARWKQHEDAFNSWMRLRVPLCLLYCIHQMR